MTGHCVVIGKAVTPAGAGGVRVEFTPEHGGIAPGGELVAWGRVEAFSDRAGQLRVELAWSSIVGTYTVRFLSQEFRIRVPDAPTARLADLIRSTG